MRNEIVSRTYLENDRLPLDLWHILEDGIDDMEKLVSL